MFMTEVYLLVAMEGEEVGDAFEIEQEYTIAAYPGEHDAETARETLQAYTPDSGVQYDVRPLLFDPPSMDGLLGLQRRMEHLNAVKAKMPEFPEPVRAAFERAYFHEPEPSVPKPTRRRRTTNSEE